MKVISAALLGGFLANAGAEPQRGPVFAAAAFARLPSSTPELEKRFSWPATKTFETTHQRFAGAAPLRLLQGLATVDRGEDKYQQQVVVALDPTPGGDGALPIHVSTSRYDGEIADALEGVPVDLWLAAAEKPIGHTTGRVTVRFVPTTAVRALAVDTAAWTDWTYTTTLMAVPRPVYVAAPRRRDGPAAKAAARYQTASNHLARIQEAMKAGKTDQALAAITAALATSVDQTGVWDHEGWANVARWAEEQHALDAALGIRARFQPIGWCSTDTGPEEAAIAYADLCYAAGKLGCFLNLQVQVMGDQFERVAYSAFGEAAQMTQSNRLRNIGIDAARFMRGLVFRFGVPGVQRRELETWRLARSMNEAGLAREMKAFLKTAAARPALDTYNRMRAAETYVYLRLQTEPPDDGLLPGPDAKARSAVLESIRADLASFKLPQPTAGWVRALAGHN